MSEREHQDSDDAGQHTPSDATASREAQLQHLIADLPAAPKGISLRAGWQDSVLAQIDAAEAEADAIEPPMTRRTGSHPRRWIAAAAVLAAAAAVVIALAVDRYRGGTDPSAASPRLAFEIQPGDRPRRSSDASIGDNLVVRGVVDGTGELRIYNTGTEIARCAQTMPDCVVERSGTRTTLRLTIALRAPGAIHAALFSAPLGAATTGLDGDLEAARRAGIPVITRALTVH